MARLILLAGVNPGILLFTMTKTPLTEDQDSQNYDPTATYLSTTSPALLRTGVLPPATGPAPAMPPGTTLPPVPSTSVAHPATLPPPAATQQAAPSAEPAAQLSTSTSPAGGPAIFPLNPHAAHYAGLLPATF